MLFATFNCYFVPMQVAFDDPIFDSTPFTVANSFIDFIFLCDIMICFRTVYLDDKGNEQSNSKLMALNYIKTSFIIDILATVPFDVILSTIEQYRIYKQDIKKTGGVPWVDLLGIFKLGRLLRLNDIISFMKASDDVKSSLKLVKLIMFLIVYIHLFACNWWFMIKSDKVWIPPIDMPRGKLYKIYVEPSTSSKYLKSL